MGVRRQAMKFNSKRCLRILVVAIIFAALFMLINQIFPDMDLSLVHIEGTSELDILRNKQHNTYMIESLQHQIGDLQRMLNEKSHQLKLAKQLKAEKGETIRIPNDRINFFIDGDKVLHYMEMQKSKSNILRKTAWKNEYDVHQFTMFDRNFIYKLDLGLKLRPQDILSSRRDWDEEFKEVIQEGVNSLNRDRSRSEVSPTYMFSTNDFLHGFFRIETNTGTQYILIYKPTSSPNILNKDLLFEVIIFRPFAPLQLVSSSLRKSDEKIYFIVPLQGREDTFRIFLEYFKDFAIAGDGNVFLLVVYYGAEGFRLVEHYLEVLKESTGFKDFKILPITDEEFSRGRALQRGATSITNDSALMFFCDVDVGFTREFLHQCRSQASPGKSVFYPIVFSLFNPELVYEGQPVPAFRDRQIIKRDNGMWRDFGFGMSCQYLSDFKDIGGFDLSIKGWGSEDTFLYRKYTQSDKLMVIRSPVNSLFHHWHPKHCDKSLAQEQYEACLRSRSRTEGSQTMLGRQYFQLKDKLEALAFESRNSPP